jgi:hypothetical protein
VYKIEGAGEELHIHVRGRRLSSECLRELIALFSRYKGPMSQLAQFENPSNRKWFKDPRAFWHRQVFLRRKHSKKAPKR